MKLLRKLRHLLWPFARHEPPPEQVEHLRFLKDARRYGIEQQRASHRVQRELKQAAVNRVEAAYLHKHWEGRDE